MKRIRLGLLAVGAAVLGGLFARGAGVEAQPAPPEAAAGRTLSLATLAPAGSTWMRVLTAWNRELRRRTNNALSLRIYPGGVQGDESEVVRKIRQGRLDGGSITAVGLSAVHRPALAFQMPGMFADSNALDAARRATATEINTAFTTAGFAFMGWADVGVSRVYSRTPVAAPTEMRGLHPYLWRDDRVMPAFFEEAGVSPVRLQLPEVLSALQTNRVDSFVTTPSAANALQWAQHVTHMTDQPVAVVVGATILSNTSVNALPADQQAILRETATQFHQLLIGNLRRDEAATLRGQPGRNIQTVAVSAAQRTQWMSMFERTRTRLGSDIAPPEFIARLRAAR